MKKYRIIKIAFAKDIRDAFLKEDKAEIVIVELVDELEDPNKIISGFKSK